MPRLRPPRPRRVGPNDEPPGFAAFALRNRPSLQPRATEPREPTQSRGLEPSEQSAAPGGAQSEIPEPPPSTGSRSKGPRRKRPKSLSPAVALGPGDPLPVTIRDRIMRWFRDEGPGKTTDILRKSRLHRVSVKTELYKLKREGVLGLSSEGIWSLSQAPSQTDEPKING
jgi:hypothetical protein